MHTPVSQSPYYPSSYSSAFGGSGTLTGYSLPPAVSSIHGYTAHAPPRGACAANERNSVGVAAYYTHPSCATWPSSRDEPLSIIHVERPRETRPRPARYTRSRTGCLTCRHKKVKVCRLCCICHSIDPGLTARALVRSDKATLRALQREGPRRACVYSFPPLFGSSFRLASVCGQSLRL